MILIGGSLISVAELPHSGLIDYTVENSAVVLPIKLKTVAKSSNCFKVFLHDKFKSLELYPDVQDKTVYFRDDAHLVSLLSSQEEEKPEVVNVEEPEEALVTAPVVSGTEVKDVENLIDVDTSLPDSFLNLPMQDDDIDSLRLQLEMKQKIIAQKDSLIKELKVNQDNIFKVQEAELLEMRLGYDKTIEEANEMLRVLKEQVGCAKLAPAEQEFLKFLSYAKNPRASARRGFSEEEQKMLGKLRSTFFVFACSAGGSIFGMLKEIKLLMERKPNIVIVDFTNDIFLATKYRIVTKDTSMSLSDATADVASLIKVVDNVKLIPSSSFNDIAFLTMDWAQIVLKLNAFAGGKPVILLFNNINSFAVRYVVAKLVFVGELHIFASCSPIVLNSLYSDIKFIPEAGAKVVCLEYIDVVKAMVEDIGKKHQVFAFPKVVDWKKLGLNV